jgi:IS30 family transposase
VGKIPNRVDIARRPAGAENRSRRGHWEAGTVVSRNGKQAAAVFVERKNRYYIAIKMKNKTAEEMLRATIKAPGFLPSRMRRTITFDNGLENALHEKINAALGTRSYFCKPYHSREKGSIENRNGILRRYFPKRHNWGLTTQKELNNIVDRINNTPMKCLRFRTPSEVFAGQGGVALPA